MADKKSWYDDDDDDDKDDFVIKKTVKSSGPASSIVRGPSETETLLASASGDDNAKLVELMDRVEPLVKSIDTLMNQFAAGVELRPPLERIAQLETLMNTLKTMPKVTPAYRFRFQNVEGIYSSYKTRWAKLNQDLESGKIKRFAAPKKRNAA